MKHRNLLDPPSTQLPLPLNQQPRRTRPIRRPENRLTLFTLNIERHARPSVVARTAKLRHDLVEDWIRPDALDTQTEDVLDRRRRRRHHWRLMGIESGGREPLQVRNVGPVV
jgi:hypothetical protein